MLTPLNTTDERYLVSLIQDRTGLILNKHQVEELQRLVGEAMTTHHLGELKEFLQVFPFTHPLWQGFIQRMTIGETYFFRNAAHFNALRHDILMPLITERRKSGFRQLRLWSAGCATGEEPYSIAMLLRELIHDIEDWAITLLATDINAGFLDMAREGLYGQRAFRGETPSWIQPRWFRLESGKYRLNQDVRQMVMFRPLNLVTDDYPSAESFTANMDLILCRNVTIYFSEATTRRVVDRFHRALNDKGWLVVGHSEPNNAVYGAFSIRNLRNTIVYQKIAPSITTQKLPPSPNATKPLPHLVSTAQTAPAPKPAPMPPVEVAAPPATLDLLDEARRAADGERWPAALKLLDAAEQQDAMQPYVHYLRGIIYQQTGDANAAMNALRQAVYCDPECVLAHYALGELFAQRGTYKEAGRHFKAASRLVMGLAPGYSFPYAEDLTVEMLTGLLTFHIDRLPAPIKQGVLRDLA